jgi:hypothetical protein
MKLWYNQCHITSHLKIHYKLNECFITTILWIFLPEYRYQYLINIYIHLLTKSSYHLKKGTCKLYWKNNCLFDVTMLWTTLYIPTAQCSVILWICITNDQKSHWNLRNILWHVDPLLGNDSGTNNYKSVVTRQRTVKSNRGTVFSVWSMLKCHKQDNQSVSWVELN